MIESRVRYSNWVFVAALFGLLLIVPATTAVAQGERTMAMPSPCPTSSDKDGKPVPESVFKGPYIVACSGKSDCTTSDTLTVSAASASVNPIAAMCLDFGQGWREQLAVYQLEKPPQVPLSYPLASIIAGALGAAPGGASDGEKSARKRLRTVPGGKLVIDVVIKDSSGSVFRERLGLDTAGLWSSGQLALAPIQAKCAPCGFDGSVSISIPQLAVWRRATNADLTKLQLVLNGSRIPGLVPLFHESEVGGAIEFKLRRFPDKPDSVTAWEGVLQAGLAWTPRSVSVSIADDRQVLARADEELTFEAMSMGGRLLCAALALLVVGLVLGRSARSSNWGFLRDDYGVGPNVLLPGSNFAFSLAKVQMTLWTVVIVIGFVLSAAAFKSFPDVNETVVVLLGIGIGTAVGSLAVVPSRVTEEIKIFEASAKAPADKQRLDMFLKSKDILADISRDYGSTAADLHRLQNIVFTLIVMVMFIISVASTGTFPTFSNTLLALIGVSGGAYVGFKAATR